MLCYRCNGTGKYLGNGMIQANCYLCDEKGQIMETKPPKVDRKSKAYKESIKEIMDLDPELTKQEATELFDNALEKS